MRFPDTSPRSSRVDTEGLQWEPDHLLECGWQQVRTTTLLVRSWRSVLTSHDARIGLNWAALVVTLLALTTVPTTEVAAQGGTPIAGEDIPAPSECTVEPRSEDELRALFREVAATPLPDSIETSRSEAPQGEPADAQTAAEINATWRMYIACINIGDQSKMFALLSDDLVRRQFVVDLAFGVTEDALFDYLAATPIPLLPDQSADFVPFTDVRVLSDGRVAAIEPGDQRRGEVRIFAREGDRWVIDDWYDLT
jgi:hypothetical protein